MSESFFRIKKLTQIPINNLINTKLSHQHPQFLNFPQCSNNIQQLKSLSLILYIAMPFISYTTCKSHKFVEGNKI